MREGVPGIEDLHEEGSLCGRIMLSILLILIAILTHHRNMSAL